MALRVFSGVDGFGWLCPGGDGDGKVNDES
jgi:hypothetical protein